MTRQWMTLLGVAIPATPTAAQIDCRSIDDDRPRPAFTLCGSVRARRSEMP